MPVVQVLRTDLPWEFCLSVSDDSEIERDSQPLAGFLEDLEVVCLGGDADCWKEEPVEQQRKLRLEQ
jgi:hypothetical protein